MKTKPTFGNCFFAIYYLVLRRKLARLVAVPGRSRLWPYHFMTFTRSGHLLHFKYQLPHQQNTYAPFWFLGAYEGVIRSRVEKTLNRQRICWELRNPLLIALWWSAVFFTLLPLWLLVWSVFSFWYFGKWTIHGLKKRFKFSTKPLTL